MTSKSDVKLGQFNFDDGGVYIGGCDGGKAHGFGICTGPMGQGEFCGVWQGGFELSGIFTWSKDSRYSGQWMQGKRHGLGVEGRGHWLYAGEFTQGAMGRYGIKKSTKSEAKYEGTWTHGLQDGYGRETYADLGSYQGQWMKGCRHGYGVRKSAVYSKACFIQDHGKRRRSLTSTRSSYEPLAETPQSETPENPEHINSDMMKATKIGHFLASCKFVLAFNQSTIKSKHSEGSVKSRSRSALKLVAGSIRGLKKKQRSSSSEHVKSFGFNSQKFPLDPMASWQESNADNEDNEVMEIYSGEWKQDRRDGYGICERTDGIKYEGEWLGNRRHGYGVTYYSATMKEEGRYKDDVLVEKNSRGKLLQGFSLPTKKKERERIAAAVAAAHRVAQMANQKSDIANSRMESARLKATSALEVEERAKQDADKAVEQAKEVKRLELDALTNKKQTKLKKKPSIPRNQIMMDRGSLRTSGGHKSSLQSDLGTIDENFKSNLESSNSFNKPTRPNSLQLLNKNTPAPQIMTFPNQIPFYRPPTSTISSTSSTIPSQICEKIDNYFSYLNDEDASSHDGDRRSHHSRRGDSDSRRQRGVNSIDSRENYLPLLMSFVTDSNTDQPIDDSGFRMKKQSPCNRRLTLPSIIKSFDNQQKQTELDVPKVVEYDSGISLDLPQSRKVQEKCDVLIVDGQRKFMEVQSCANVAMGELEYPEDDKLLELPKTVKLKKLPAPRRQELGSMPDLSRVQKFVGESLPWKEVEFLSKQKRMEIERRRQVEENLRKRSLIIRVGDFKLWLSRNMCSIIIVVVNILLVAIFYVLLK